MMIQFNFHSECDTWKIMIRRWLSEMDSQLRSFNLNATVVIYSKIRSRKTIGAIKDQPYRAAQTQLEMILIHIEAGFEFNFSSVEFGLQCMNKGSVIRVWGRTRFKFYAFECAGGKYLLIPIGKRHHNIECGSNKNAVEQCPWISDTVFLIVIDLCIRITWIDRFVRVSTFFGC